MATIDEPAPRPDDVTAAFVDAGAAMLGLVIRPDWRAGVLLNMTAIAAAAALVRGRRLDDDLEAAPVFEA